MKTAQALDERKVNRLNNIEQGLYLDGVIEGIPANLLVDSGASVTVISPRIFETVQAQSEKRLEPSKWQVKAASGALVAVRGQTSLQFRAGQHEWTLSALVADIEDDGILGMDFLREAIINCKEQTLSVDDVHVPLTNKNLGKTCYRVYLENTVEIPENGRMRVSGRVKHGAIGTSAGILSSSERRPHLAVEEAVVGLGVGEESIVPLCVNNESSSPMRLRGGTVIAVCEPVDEVCCNLRVQISSEQRQTKEMPEHLKDLYTRSTEFLVESEQKEVKALLLKFQHVFSAGPDDLGRTDVVQHKIDTGDAKPIRIPPRRVPLAKRGETEACIKDMREQQIIQPSNSPWSAPVVLVKKKDGSTRFCIDYRALNEVTKKDSFPIPRIDTVLDSLSGSSWFSTLDLKSGYWQVGMDAADQEKTAFSTGDNLWQFTVMPFGLCNSPATFSRLMSQVLQDVPPTACLKYLDDVVVHATTFQGEVRSLETVLKRLGQAGLKLNAKKCHLFQRQVTYLGHVVSQRGLSTDPKKIEAVAKWPRPTDKTAVKSFLGLCSYYRRFVCRFADKARPLHYLTEDRTPFKWTEECEQAFDGLKDSLTKAPVLVLPSEEDTYILDTDASDRGIGAVLSQVKDEQERVVAYHSKALSRPERNFCVTRRELLAVISGISHFHHYLYGRTFQIRTDHSALQWLTRFRAPEGQIARWLQKLQEYDFVISHRPGKKHANADAMSRRPCNDDCNHCKREEEKEGGQVENKREKAEEIGRSVNRTTVVPTGQMMTHSMEHLEMERRRDPAVGVIIGWMEVSAGKPEWKSISPQSLDVKGYWMLWDSLRLQDGVLFYRWETPSGDRTTLLRVLPTSMRKDAWLQLHADPGGGHMGAGKTLGKLRERFFWTGQREDVKRWCEMCDVCEAKKGPSVKRRSPLQQYHVGYPGERVAVDIMGPLPETTAGNRYLLCAMDYFTKWPEAYPLPDQEATTVADALIHGYVSRFGVPEELHSDQGRNFESAVFKGMLNMLGVKKTRTTPLHPQSDGMVERYNRTIGTQLAMYAQDNPAEWDKHIPLLLLAYRSATHEATRETPAKLMLGRELALPIDLLYGIPEDREKLRIPQYLEKLDVSIGKAHAFARMNIQKVSDRAKARHDRHADTRQYEPGDSVWLYNPQRKKGVCPKLTSPWKGPYIVLTRLNEVVYRIREGQQGKPCVVHKDRLKPYRGDVDRS